MQVGGVLCNVVNDADEELFTTTLNKNSWHYAVCNVSGIGLGSGVYNVTFSTQRDTRGDAMIMPSAYKVDPETGRPYMVELSAAIKDIYPRIGTSSGGSRITLTGDSFSIEKAQNEVYVGGAPCEILSTSRNEMVCRMAAREPLPDHMCNTTFCPGGRGALFKQFGGKSFGKKMHRNVNGVNHRANGLFVAQLRAWEGFPHAPDRTEVLNDFASNRNIDDNYAMHVSAYFRAPSTSNYTFYANADDDFEVWFKRMDGSRGDGEMIMGCYQCATGQTDWARVEREDKGTVGKRISKKIAMQAGEYALLTAMAYESGGGDHISVGVKQHRTTVKPSQSSLSKIPQQKLSVWSTTPMAEHHTLTLDGATSGSYSLQLGGVTAPTLSFDADEAQIEEAVKTLTGVQCTVTEPADQQFYDLDTFENGPGSSDEWVKRNYVDPEIVSNVAPHCGRHSLYFADSGRGGSWGRNFEYGSNLEAGQTSAGYDTNEFPYLCMAYKMPAGTQANLLFRIKTESGEDNWFRVDTQPNCRAGCGWSAAATFHKSVEGNADPLIFDNQWHHKCINLDQQFDAKFGPAKHTVRAVIWHGYRVQGAFHIDDFAIAKQPRTISRGEIAVQDFVSDVSVCKMPCLFNMAVGKPATQDAGWGGLTAEQSAVRAVDGNTATSWGSKSCTHNANGHPAWWRVDLEEAKVVHEVKITNRGDCCGERLRKFEVKVGNVDDWKANTKCGASGPMHVVRNCSASSSHPAADYGCMNAFDGNLDTNWATHGEGVGSWIRADFGMSVTIAMFSYKNRDGSSNNNKEITLSFDAGDTQMFQLNEDTGSVSIATDVFTLSPKVTTTYVRIEVNSVYQSANNGARMIEFFGEGVSSPTGVLRTEEVAQGATTTVACGDLSGQYVYVLMPFRATMSLCEVQVMGYYQDPATVAQTLAAASQGTTAYNVSLSTETCQSAGAITVDGSALTAGTASIVQTHAPRALGGSIGIAFKGTSTQVSAASTGPEWAAALAHVTGAVDIKRSGTCRNFDLDVQWMDSGGDHGALLVPDPTQSTGGQVATKVELLETGGLYFRPIPGTLLHVPADRPIVMARVNGLPAHCDGDCTVSFHSSSVTVSGISPTTATAGTEVRITGTGFTSATKVSIGGEPCVVTAHTDTEIVATVGSGEAMPQAKVLVSGDGEFAFAQHTGVVGNTTEGFHTLNLGLVLSTITPTAGSHLGGATVTISGTGLPKQHRFASTKVSLVWLGGTVADNPDCAEQVAGSCIAFAAPCGTIDGTTASHSCRTTAVPVGAAGTAKVMVDIDGVRTLGPDYATDTTPGISAVSTDSLSVMGGTPVTITGTQLGGTDTVVRYGDTPCVLQSNSGTLLVCVVAQPRSTMTQVNLTVTLPAVGLANGHYSGTFNADPLVGGVLPSSGFSQQNIFVYGRGFSTTPSDNTISFGHIPCMVTASSPGGVNCTIGARSIGSEAVQVTVAGKGVASGSGTFSWTSSLRAITPTQGSVNGGTLITLTGDGFSSLAQPVEVLVGPDKCAVLPRNATDETIICQVKPPQTVPTDPVPVSLSGATCGGSCDYSFSSAMTPVVTGISPTTGGLSTVLVIAGSGFATGASDNIVSVGGSECSITSFSATELRCTVPAMVAGSHAVVVTSQTNLATMPSTITFEYLLRIIAVHPNQGSVSGGSVVTLTGDGFSPTLAYNYLNVGGQICRARTASYSQVECVTGGYGYSSYDFNSVSQFTNASWNQFSELPGERLHAVDLTATSKSTESMETGAWGIQKWTKDFSYEGCYKDRGSRDLTVHAGNDYSGMTAKKCGHMCRAYRHFGTQYSFQCFCGNSFGKYGAQDESTCNRPCRGDANENCGGRWRNSVYSHKGQQAVAQTAQVYYEPLFTPHSIVNLARGKPTFQSTEAHGGVSSRAVDGSSDSNWNQNTCTHTDTDSTGELSASPHWGVDLQQVSDVGTVRMWSRDCCSWDQLVNADVYAGNSSDWSAANNTRCGFVQSASSGGSSVVDCAGTHGRYVHVIQRTLPARRRRQTSRKLMLCEVEVFSQRHHEIPQALRGSFITPTAPIDMQDYTVTARARASPGSAAGVMVRLTTEKTYVRASLLDSAKLLLTMDAVDINDGFVEDRSAAGNASQVLGRMNTAVDSAWYDRTLTIRTVDSGRYLTMAANGNNVEAVVNGPEDKKHFKICGGALNTAVTTTMNLLRSAVNWKAINMRWNGQPQIRNTRDWDRFAEEYEMDLILQSNETYVIHNPYRNKYLQIDPSSGAFTACTSVDEATRFVVTAVPTYLGEVGPVGSAPAVVGEGVTFDRKLPSHTRAIKVGDVLDAGMSNYTVSLWFRGDDVNALRYTTHLAQKGNWHAYEPGWSIRVWANKLSFRGSHQWRNSKTHFEIVANVTLRKHIFYHAAMVVHRPVDGPVVVYGYLNGQLVGSKDLTLVCTDTNQPIHGCTTSTPANPQGYNLQAIRGAPLVIGQRDDYSPDSPFGGTIDQFAIWTDALSHDEIKLLHNEGTGRNSFYRFTTGGIPNSHQLVKQHNGEITVLAHAPSALAEDAWYSLELQAAGTTLTASVDGTTVLTSTDTSGAALPSGNIGLFSSTVHQDSVPGSTVFDDVSVDAPLNSFADNTAFQIQATVRAVGAAGATPGSATRRVGGRRLLFENSQQDDLVSINFGKAKAKSDSGNGKAPTSVTTSAGADQPFSYSAADTPEVISATLVEGTLTVTGTNFVTSGNTVSVGDTTATVTSASATQIVATVPAIPAGTHLVKVSTAVGMAESHVHIFQSLSISSLAPTEGSFNGGQSITLSGSGFSATKSENFVSTCGLPCAVTAASATSLTCETGTYLNVGEAHRRVSTNIAAKLDDAAEDVSNGRMYTTTTQLNIPFDGSKKMITALRFTNVDIARGATIQSARVQFQVRSTSGTAVTLAIQGEAVDSAAEFSSTKYDISSRARTTASVEWQPTDWNVAGVLKYSSDVSDILTEVVARPGWSPGNSVVLIFSLVSGTGTRKAFSFDYYKSGAGAPYLMLTVMPPTSAALLAFDNADTKACDVEVKLEHEDSYKGDAKCAAVSDLSRGRPVWAASKGDATCMPVHVEVLSSGANDGNSAKISINGKDALRCSRGLNIAVVDRYTHAVKATGSFDTFATSPDSERFAMFVNEIVPGDIVLVAVMYDAARMQEAIAKEALASIGASNQGDLEWYESFALIAVKGTTAKGTGSTAIESVRAMSVEERALRWKSPSRRGVRLERAFDCGLMEPHGNAQNNMDWEWMLNAQRTTTFAPMVPSSGLAVDNDKASFWYSVGAHEMTWEVDLGGMKAIAEVDIAFKYPPQRMALLTSATRETWELAYSTDNVVDSGSQTVLFDGAPKPGRYLRIFAAGSQLDYMELSDRSTTECKHGTFETLSSVCHPCSWAASAIRSWNETNSGWGARVYSTLLCDSSEAIHLGTKGTIMRALSNSRILSDVAAGEVCAAFCSQHGVVSPLCTCGVSPAAVGWNGVGVVARQPVLGITDVTVNGCDRVMTATVANGFTYDKAITPRITSVTPNRGSTAGGTDITMAGSGFGNNAADVVVNIMGIPCTVSSVTPTAVVCTTGAHGPTNTTHPGKGMVHLTVAGQGAATAAADTYWYVDLWSRTTTWGGNAPPVEGDSVEIPAGQTVLLDISPPQLVAVVIMGTLVFDRKDLTFDAGYIIVLGKTAALEVGTEQEPFLENAVITLHGHPKSPELPVYGAKMIAVREGRLDLHGKPLLRTWTMLSKNAVNGSDTLSLQAPVDWTVGTEVVVASTDFEKEHAEQVTITAVSGDGLTLTVNPPMRWLHLGETRFIAGHAFEYRAEVGVLTRNVRIKGDHCSYFCSTEGLGGVSDGMVNTQEAAVHSVECTCEDTGQIPAEFGAQIFMHSIGDESLVSRIENIEVTNAGQAFRLGRYPIHFHMIGTVHQSYVKRNSVHHTFNRGITIHGVHHLRVIENVAYHTRGNTFFIEDAIETKNVIEGNLGVCAFASNALLNTDQTPAMFWIVNPDNIVRNNHAAGSQNYGFWYRAEDRVTGASAAQGLGDGTCPKGTPLLEFSGNTAHSNGKYGFRLYDQYYPLQKPCSRKSATNPYVTARFRDFHTWRNKKNGLQISAGAQLVFQRFYVADNTHAGIEMPGAQGGHLDGAWGTNRVDDSIIVGSSGPDWRVPHKGKRRLSKGIEVPAWHRLLVTNTTFANFEDCCALAAMPKVGFKPKGGGWETRFEKIKWVNAPMRYEWEHPHEGVFTDVDGTLTETGVPNSAVVPYNTLLPAFAKCRAESALSGNLDAWICTDTTFRRINVNDMLPTTLRHKYLKVKWGEPGTVFVKPEDTAYLQGKWRIQGVEVTGYISEWYLIEWNQTAGSSAVTMAPVEGPYRGKGFWTRGTGRWLNTSHLNMSFVQSDGSVTRTMGVISADQGHMTWSDGSKPWVSCSVHPVNCTGTTRYPQPEMKVVYDMMRAPLGKGYEFNVPTGNVYDVEFDTLETDRVDLTNLKMHVSDMNADDHLWLRFPHNQYVDHIDVPSSINKTNALPAKKTVLSGVAVDPPRPAKSGIFGDWTWDNRTMTSTVLLRGRRGNPETEMITGTYKVKPCPDTWCGCNCEDPNALEFDGTIWRWSDPATWAHFGDAAVSATQRASWSLGVPQQGDEVTIPARTKVIVDVAPPKLKMLTIAGIVEFARKSTPLKLEAINIVVRGGGRFSIGNATHPYEGPAEVVLHGDRLTRGFRFNQVDYGAKALTVFGQLELYGKSRAPRWTHLSVTAQAGASTIQVNGPVDWKASDKIVIAPTGYDTSEVDVATITAVSHSGDVATVTLASPLQFKHYVGTEQHGSRSVTFTCEVMLTTSNVVVRGGDREDWAIFHSLHEQEFGASISITKASKWDEVKAKAVVETGSAQISDIEVRNGGHAGFDRRMAIEFYDLGEMRAKKKKSFVRRCAINLSYNTAIYVGRSEGVELTGNAAYYTLGSTYDVMSEGNRIIGNLGIRTVAEVTHNDGSARSNLKKVAWEYYPGTFEIARGNIVWDNTAAGSERIGFKMRGTPCTGPTSRDWQGSVVHSSIIGVAWRGGGTQSEDCTLYRDIKIWKAWTLGIWTQTRGSVQMEKLEISDSKVGMLFGLVGPPGESHVAEYTEGRISDSIFVGASAGNADCTSPMPEKVDAHHSKKRDHDIGFMSGSFAPSVVMVIPEKFSWKTLQMGYPPLYGKYKLNGVTFANYITDACGKVNKVFDTNSKVPDNFPPHHFSNIEKVNVGEPNLVNFKPPAPGWIKIDDCVTMDCDGPKHIILRDEDGTLTGSSNAGASILAKAEFVNSNAYGYKAPTKFLTMSNGTIRREEDAIAQYGVPRDGCTEKPEWNAWKCPTDSAGTYRRLIMESMDHDTEERSLVPVVLTHTATSTSDLMNGGQDHGWCMGYTCLKRLSTFHGIVSTPAKYELTFAGTNPQSLRYHLRSESKEDAVVLKVWYSNPQRLQVYVDGEYISDLNWIDSVHRCKTAECASDPNCNTDCDQYVMRMPDASNSNGANAFDYKLKYLHLTVKGNVPVLIKTLEVVQVSMTVSLGVDDFFDQASFTRNMAFVLGIDPTRIQRVTITAGNGRRSESPADRRLLSQDVGVNFEVGPPHCENGVKDIIHESDIDCGGVCNTTCAAGKICFNAGDCTDKICTKTTIDAANGTCAQPSCSDGIQNGIETGIDCGGDCTGCATGIGCSVNTDCQSLECQSGSCQAPTCYDTAKNGLESDVNCGGGSCSPCSTTQACSTGTDCISGVCLANQCAASTCSDGVANQGESDVDCSGPCNATCAMGAQCVSFADCTSYACAGGVCSSPICSDGVRNGLETDTDCGGSSCDACPPGRTCNTASDCTSQVCTQGMCAAPTCFDGKKNGGQPHPDPYPEPDPSPNPSIDSPPAGETGVDCGGECRFVIDGGSGSNKTCAPGSGCAIPEDCNTAMCTSEGTCMDATCTDGEQNGAESSIDCGGNCAKCPVGDACAGNSDCIFGKCDMSDPDDMTCAPASCDDGVMNGDEVGVDCGGSNCGSDNRCPSGHVCTINDDCTSELCYQGQCLDTLCSDFTINEAAPTFESDAMYDCTNGKMCGSCGGLCFPCAEGYVCRSGSDCETGVCNSDNKCAAPSCFDGVKNGLEVVADCGGGCTCAAGLSCSTSSQCQSQSCIAGVCAAPTCDDGVVNRQESDVDCGDSFCGACAVGKSCTSPSNCLNKVCSNSLCLAPTCFDGVRNGVELDTDCGQAAGCGLCRPMQACVLDGDCTSNHCLGSVCQSPACDDGRKNGGETATDCGGSCSAKCPTGNGCAADTDCVSTDECRAAYGPASNTTCQTKPPEGPDLAAAAISSAIQESASSGALGDALGMTVAEVTAFSTADKPQVFSIGSLPAMLQMSSGSSASNGFKILYTLDNSDPTCGANMAVSTGTEYGTVYHASNPPTVSGTKVVKAIACGDELYPSQVRIVTVHVYTDTPELTSTGTHEASVVLSVASGATEPGFKILYTVEHCLDQTCEGATPACPSTGTEYTLGTTIQLVHSAMVKAVSCAAHTSPSGVRSQLVQLKMRDPTMTAGVGYPMPLSIWSGQSSFSGHKILYTMAEQHLPAPGYPTCPDQGTLYTSTTRLLATQHAVVRAVVCGSHAYSSKVITDTIIVGAPSPRIGFVTDTYPFTVTMAADSNATSGHAIHYTLGGIVPPTCNASDGSEVFSANSLPVVSAPTTVLAVTCGSHLTMSDVANITVAQVAQPILTATALDRRSGVIDGRVGVSLNSATPDSSIYYTTDGTMPACFGVARGLPFTATLTLLETTTLRAIACAAGVLPSTVLIQEVTVRAKSPMLTVTSSETSHSIQLTSANELANGFTLRYSIDETCSETSNVSCTSGSLYSSPIELVSNQHPLFYTGSAYSCCIKAVACGGDSLLSSAMVTLPVVIAGEAPVVTHKVHVSMTLTGYTVDTFDATAQTAFASGVAAHAGVHSSQIVITGVSDPSAANSTNATTSRRTAGAVKVDFHIESSSADQAQALTATMTAVQSNPAALVTALQASGLTAVQDIAVAQISTAVVETASPPTPATPTGTRSTDEGDNLTLYWMIGGVVAGLMVVGLLGFAVTRGTKALGTSVSSLINDMQHSDPASRRNAAALLRKRDSEELEVHMETLLKLLLSEDIDAAAAASQVLAAISVEALDLHVMPLLASSDWRHRKATMSVLGHSNPEVVADHLAAVQQGMGDGDAGVRLMSIKVFSNLPDKELNNKLGEVVRLLDDAKWEVQQQSVVVLEKASPLALAQQSELLLRLTHSQNDNTRTVALQVLSRLPTDTGLGADCILTPMSYNPSTDQGYFAGGMVGGTVPEMGASLTPLWSAGTQSQVGTQAQHQPRSMWIPGCDDQAQDQTMTPWAPVEPLPLMTEGIDVLDAVVAAEQTLARGCGPDEHGAATAFDFGCASARGVDPGVDARERFDPGMARDDTPYALPVQEPMDSSSPTSTDGSPRSPGRSRLKRSSRSSKTKSEFI